MPCKIRLKQGWTFSPVTPILWVMERERMAEKRPMGLTGAEIAEAVKLCLVAYAEYMAKTGKDPVAEWVAGWENKVERAA